MSGPPPKPVEQRIREGNPGRRPLPDVVLIGGRPAADELEVPPAHLPDDAKEFWSEAVGRLLEVNLLDRVDVFALEMLATQYARVRMAQRVIAEDGFFTRGSVGQLREHPAMKIEREATTLFLKLADNFALTPVARTRLGLAALEARSLQNELGGSFGSPNLTPVDG